MAKQKVLVIVGPTASGKSDLAVRLAKRFNGEIISADSRQVYKGLNTGTGKITKKEMGGIPHHLLDVANPKKRFSVSDFVKKAKQAVTTIYHSGHLPIVVGGTGLYIDVLTGTINFPDVPPNQKLRKKLGKKSAEKLFKILEEKDPERAATIHQHNKVRLIRALEIIESLGSVPQLGSRTSKYDPIFIGLKPNDLKERIYQRLIKRLPGIIRECKKLHTQGLAYKRMYELGLEYRYTSMYLQGKTSREGMVKKLFIEIRRYAKRQMTWFRRNKKIRWFTPSEVEGFKPKEYRKIERYLRKKYLV